MRIKIILDKHILEIIHIQLINQVDKQVEINQEMIFFNNRGRIQLKQVRK